MSITALGLILVAAVVHATWNLLAKRVSGSTSGPAFVWLYGAISTALYTVPVLWLLRNYHPVLGAREFMVMAVSGLVHLAYFLVLQQAYRVGDFSVVYPLARGTGPLLSTATAIALLGERPTVLALTGAIMIAVSVFMFASPSKATASQSPASTEESRRRRIAGVLFGVGTGGFIAFYTVWDKYAVANLGISPLLMEWTTSAARVLLLAPLAVAQWPQVRDAWTKHRAEALWIGALNPLSYLLVMIAMVTTPVSYVAPAREVSILIGAAMGVRLLGEGDHRRRLVAAGVMVLGIFALAAG